MGKIKDIKEYQKQYKKDNAEYFRKYMKVYMQKKRARKILEIANDKRFELIREKQGLIN